MYCLQAPAGEGTFNPANLKMVQSHDVRRRLNKNSDYHANYSLHFPVLEGKTRCHLETCDDQISSIRTSHANEQAKEPMDKHMCVCMYVCMYVCIYIYIHIVYIIE